MILGTNDQSQFSVHKVLELALQLNFLNREFSKIIDDRKTHEVTVLEKVFHILSSLALDIS